MSKILLVDDDKTILDIIRACLEDLGFQCLCAANGDEAVQRYQHEQPELIILDLNMPGKSGMDVLKIVRCLEDHADANIVYWTPIIMLTGTDDNATLEQAIECGVDDYLVKPVQLPSLVAKVKSLLRLSEARNQYVSLFNRVNEASKRHEYNEKQLNEILNSAPFGIIGVDAVGFVQNVNTCASELFGYPTQTLKGQNASMLFDDETAGYFKSLMDEYVEKKEVTGVIVNMIEVDGLKNTGVRFPVSVSVSKFVVGDLVHFIGMFEDLTEKNILRKRFEISTKLEAMGNLAAGIAHDFNNILATAVGYANLALDYVESHPDEKLHRYLAAINASHLRAKNLVSQMLDFGQRKNKAQTINMNDLIQQSHQFFSEVIPKRIDFQLDLPDTPIYVYGEVNKIEQVIMNLIINAKDAIEAHGRILIKIDPNPHAGCYCVSCQQNFSGHYYRVTVEDTGCGMDKATMERIFEPFFSTKGPSKGTGMGLSVVHGILHSFDGHVAIQSTLGEGTQIHLCLPMHNPHPEDVDSQEDAHEPEVLAQNSKAHTLCILDDEVGITDYLAELLEGHDFNLLIYNDPIRLVADCLAGKIDFELLITDQSMPSMTGLEVATTLSYMGKHRLIFLCTGADEPEGLAQALENKEIVKFFRKPIQNKELVAAIKQALPTQ